MSAPSGGGGAGGLGAVLSGAGGSLAMASARSFSQGIPHTEAIRLDWDFFQGPTANAGIVAVGALPNGTIVLGRGTWHVQAQVFLQGAPASAIAGAWSLRAPSVTGFVYDFTGACEQTVKVEVEAIIALGPTDGVVLFNEIAIAAGNTVWHHFLAKRITR